MSRSEESGVSAGTAGYLAENASSATSLPGRSLVQHVSRELTMATGVTLQSLRRARHLYVTIVKALPLPTWAVDTDTADRIFRILASGQALSALGP
jgi:hypothetical protein